MRRLRILWYHNYVSTFLTDKRGLSPITANLYWNLKDINSKGLKNNRSHLSTQSLTWLLPQ